MVSAGASAMPGRMWGDPGPHKGDAWPLLLRLAGGPLGWHFCTGFVAILMPSHTWQSCEQMPAAPLVLSSGHKELAVGVQLPQDLLLEVEGGF